MNLYTSQDKISTLLSDLMPLHDLEFRRDDILECFREITAESLSYPLESGSKMSSLTSEGMPIELSLSFGPEGSGGLRYVTEAGELTALFGERLIKGNLIARRMIEKIGAIHALELHQSLFSLLYPEEIQNRPGCRCRFGLWHGMIHRPGKPDAMKVYYNLRPWKNNIQDAIKSVFSLLSSTANMDQLYKASLNLPDSARPVFLGLEYGSDAIGVKLYYRCRSEIQKSSIERLIKDMGFSEHIGAFSELHELLMGNGSDYPERSVVIYLKQDSKKKETSLSLYFVLARLLQSDNAAICLITQFLVDRGIDPLIYQETMKVISRGKLSNSNVLYHTLIGIGFTNKGVKINIYAKPTWESLGIVKK